jgi:hypothetical protein
MQRNRSKDPRYSPASREPARFVADWFENVMPLNHADMSDLERGDHGGERRSSAQSAKPNTKSSKVSSRPPRPPRSIPFENDIFIYQRKQPVGERHNDVKSVDKSLVSLNLPLSLAEPYSGRFSSRIETGAPLGRSWSELLVGPRGADEHRDHELAVRACRVQGVDTSPRSGKNTGRSGSHQDHEHTAFQNLDLFFRERELFLKDRALFLKERERFLAEKEDFYREKRELLRRTRDISKPPAAAEAVCSREHGPIDAPSPVPKHPTRSHSLTWSPLQIAIPTVLRIRSARAGRAPRR